MLINKSKNKGLTLIESLIWFSIFAVVMVSVFVAYQLYKVKSDGVTAGKDLSTIYMNIDKFFGAEGTLGLDNELAMQLGVFPKHLKVKGNNVYNVYGGTIVVNGSDQKTFTVTYFGIPSGASCTNLLLTQKNTGWYMANVSGESVFFDSTFKMSTVSNACGLKPNQRIIISFVNV